MIEEVIFVKNLVLGLVHSGCLISVGISVLVQV